MARSKTKPAPAQVGHDDISQYIISKIKSDHTGDHADINIEHRFDEDLGLDSLDLVELSMEVEEKYDILINDQALEKLKTVKDMVDYVARELGKK